MTNSTNIPDAYITAKIEMAQGIINGYCGDVYAVPWTADTCPDTIKAIALNFVMGLLYIDQFGQETEGTGIDGQKMIDGVTSTLKKIKSGVLRIFDSTGAEITRVVLRDPVGYPTQTSTDARTTERAFERGQKF